MWTKPYPANDPAPGMILMLVAWLASAVVWVVVVEVYLWVTHGRWAELPWLPV